MSPAQNEPVAVNVEPRKKNMSAIASAADMDLLKIDEVADFLRVSKISIYRLVAKQLLPVHRICHKLLFSKRDLISYVEKSKDGKPE